MVAPSLDQTFSRKILGRSIEEIDHWKASRLKFAVRLNVRACDQNEHVSVSWWPYLININARENRTVTYQKKKHNCKRISFPFFSFLSSFKTKTSVRIEFQSTSSFFSIIARASERVLFHVFLFPEIEVSRVNNAFDIGKFFHFDRHTAKIA